MKYTHQQINAKQLTDEWNGRGRKKRIQRQDHREYLRGPFLATDLCDVLRRSSGSSTWREFEFQINHMVSYNYTRRHIQSILDFTHQASRIYPMLDSQAEAGRLQ